eukprot:5780293-Amphidinium_carterae.1
MTILESLPEVAQRESNTTGLGNGTIIHAVQNWGGHSANASVDSVELHRMHLSPSDFSEIETNFQFHWSCPTNE